MIRKFKPFTLLIALHILIIILALVVIKTQRTPGGKGKEKIVVMSIDGMISSGHGNIRSGVSVDEMTQSINKLAEDKDVKALVLRINSPGGSVGAVQDIYSSLIKFKSSGKKVISSFADISASGGYYVACASDYIYAQPGTLTGSIGVVMQLPNVSGLLNRFGVRFESIKSGNMKDSGSPFREMTQNERLYFKEIIMSAYEQFFKAVSEGRKLDRDTLKPLADGRIFTGEMALNNKLIDGLGGLDEAISKAKELTGLKTSNPEIVFHKDKRSLDKILEMLSYSPLQNFTKVSSSVQLSYTVE